MSTAEIERLIRDAITLRRAEREGAPEYVGDVRDDLERIIGPPVSRALAARVLGVSQTALDRHVRAGTIPTVIAPDGHLRVPVTELARLGLEVDDQRRRRAGDRPLAAALRERAREALRVPVTRIVEEDGSVPMGHRPAELRGLAYHRAIATRLDRQMLSDARRRLRRWKEAGSIHPHWASEWEALLASAEDEIGRVISADDERGRALRQSSPFAGTFPEPVRRRLMGLVSVDG